MKNMFDKILENKEKLTNKFGEPIHIDSIMVLENGKKYSKYYTKLTLHEMRSISKVFVALAYGIAIDRGLVDADTYVYPELSKVVKINNKDNVKKFKKCQIKHLLTYACGYSEQMFSEKFLVGLEPKDYLDYVVNYPLAYEPGVRHAYNNGDMFLLSVYFQEKLKVNLRDFIVKEIFEPLNITNYIWENYDKYCPGGTGLYITHEDMFKLGELILNKGKYANTQIVSSKYIETMCSRVLETPYTVKAERVLPKEAVGYVMHISRDGYVFKDGKHGQYLIINFDKEEIISILASESDMGVVTEMLRGLI